MVREYKINYNFFGDVQSHPDLRYVNVFFWQIYNLIFTIQYCHFKLYSFKIRELVSYSMCDLESKMYETLIIFSFLSFVVNIVKVS